MRFSIIMLVALAAWMAGAAMAQTCDMCGDVDCDGQWTIYDGQYILDYLYNAGPAPLCDDPLWADWDYREGLTVGDVFYNQMYIFGGGPPPNCPPGYPPVVPEVDSTSIVYYTDWIPPHTSNATVALTIAKDTATMVFGLSLPLRIRVDGQIPTIDSVTVLCGDCLDSFVRYQVDADSGYISIGAVPLFGSFPDVGQIALIHLTVPEISSARSVAMEWMHLAPVQSPTQDSIIIPMFYDFPPVEPILVPHCCITPGDANLDGVVNIGDVVYNIQCIFVDCLGHPCEKQLDADCNGNWNVADVVYLINFIFKGGPPPCCL
jgi:hypothetical protein